MQVDRRATTPGTSPATVWDSLTGPARSRAAVKAAYVLSWVAAVLMVAATLPSLINDHLYTDGLWGREALRGGDVVTLILVVPLFVLSLALVATGSRRAVAVWMGVLAYTVYDYAFYAFGAEFNQVFLLHIALLSLSVYALACGLPNLNVARISEPMRSVRGARWVGLFLMVVGAVQGMLWVFVVSRNAVTGEVMHDIPVNGQHLVFALDLALSMPALVVGGLLLFRRAPFGFVLGTAMAVMGALYQVNLLVAGVYQASADVAGVTAFAPEGVVLTAAFVAGALFLLVPRGPRTGGAARDSNRRRSHLSVVDPGGSGTRSTEEEP